MNMNGKVCMVTGATSGIGQETARALAKKGAEVIVHGRSREKAERTVASIKQDAGHEQVDYVLADFSSPEETREMAEAFKARWEQLDVLVNNAGAFFLNRKETVNGWERTIAVNHLIGYFLLTNLLLDILKETAATQGEARIVNVSSGAHYQGTIHFDNLHLQDSFGGMRAYSQSKLANVLFTYELDRRLEGTNVTANALHPGFVATDFAKNNGFIARLFMPLVHLFAKSEREGAETSIYLASSPEVAGVSGKYFENCSPERSSNESYDEEVAQRLWQVSAELVGLDDTD